MKNYFLDVLSRLEKMGSSEGQPRLLMRKRHYLDKLTADLSLFNLILISCCLLSVIFFVYGFFPVKYISRNISSDVHLPSQVIDVSVNPKDYYHPRVGRLVFMVVDALRWDLLTKLENVENVPLITKLLNSKQACLYHAECTSPTVTMPRLKALMTGSVPNFIDIVLNFGSREVKGDSLIVQALHHNKKIVFFGDDTWLKMFPSAFLRSEGTTSFFVSDYEEVDLNVTRHLPKELKAKDWDIMVLHYLGLDHIGHLAGPSSPLAGPKLREMDQVVQVILEGLEKTKHSSLPPLLVLVGDHGMRNSGGHGGSTKDEVLTSLLMVLPGCSESKWFKQNVWQIDVTPTLAVLLGLPIPHNSVGTLLPGALSSLPPMHHLYALHYNTLHLRALADACRCDSSEWLSMLQDAEKLFAHLLRTGTVDTNSYEQSVQLYEMASQNISECVSRSGVEFRLPEMMASCCILFLSIVTMVQNHYMCLTKNVPKTIMWMCAIFAALSVIFLGRTVFVIIFTILYAVFSLRMWFRYQIPASVLVNKLFAALRLRDTSTSSMFLYSGCIIHAVSLFASSLIEEEHQTWYFLWTTLGLITLKTISVRIYRGRATIKAALQALIVLLAHRFLRTLNQTGDKWADLPDASDWMKEADNWWIHLLFTISGLVGIWASLLKINRKNDIFNKVIFALALTFVLLCRAATNEVQLPFSYHKSKGITEGHLFWIVLFLFIFRHLIKKDNLLEIVTSTLMLILSLLLRPHNLVILPYLIYTSDVLYSAFPTILDCTLAHSWMGSVAFFYMGNSNSLTTVDVAAGYVGASEYSTLRVGLMIFLHTYAAPIVSFLLLLRQITSDNKLRKGFGFCLEVIFLHKTIPLFCSSINCIVLRHHLFVWSVFAPKVLYEVVSFLTITLLVTPIWLAMYYFA